jgi:MFS family permease
MGGEQGVQSPCCLVCRGRFEDGQQLGGRGSEPVQILGGEPRRLWLAVAQQDRLDLVAVGRVGAQRARQIRGATGCVCNAEIRGHAEQCNVFVVLDRYRLRHYLAGATAARTGDEMSGPALLLLGLSATGSPALGSALIAGLTISSGVGGPLLGAVLDRSPVPGRLLAAALLVYAGGVAAVAALVGDVPAAMAVAVAVVAGCAGPALTGGWTAQLPRVVATPALGRAFSLDAATYGAASLAGPALAGGIAAALGAGWAVAGAVALLVAAAPAAVTMPREAAAAREATPPREAAPPREATPPREAAPPHEATPRGRLRSVHDASSPPARPPLRAELAHGVRAVAERPQLLAVTVATMLSSAGFAGLVVASPLVGERLAGSAAAGTALLSVLAVGSLVGAAALARRPWRRMPESLLVATTALLGAMFAAIAVADAFALAVAAAFVAGLAEGPQLASVFQIRHREAPAALRAQLFTTAASVKMSAFALGSAAAGALAVRSVTACLLAAAGAQAAAIAAVLVLTARERRRPVARTARA